MRVLTPHWRSGVAPQHRESLVAFHERVLVVGAGDGGEWRLEGADEYAHALAERAYELEEESKAAML